MSTFFLYVRNVSRTYIDLGLDIFSKGRLFYVAGTALHSVSKKNDNAVSNLYDPWAVGQSAIQRRVEKCIFEGRRNHVYHEYAIVQKIPKLIYLDVTCDRKLHVW